MTLRRTLSTAASRLGLRRPARRPSGDKYRAEVRFWEDQLDALIDWYEGRIPVHYRTPAPAFGERIEARGARRNAIATWLELHQKRKYLADLRFSPAAFAGLRLLDVGCGPMPSAEAFTGCRELVCLDPLLSRYLAAGYPLAHPAIDPLRLRFAEAIPLADGSVDAVISMNAPDHVDDFGRAAAEIGRVLRADRSGSTSTTIRRPGPSRWRSTVQSCSEPSPGVPASAGSSRSQSRPPPAPPAVRATTLWSNFGSDHR